MAATVAHERWPVVVNDLMDRIAGGFRRRETRLTCRDMIEAMVTIEESANCWSLAEQIGHRGPHVLQHFLSRARFDHDHVAEHAAVWAIDQLGNHETVLVIDETGDEKSSPDAVGAAHQYSGALGGVGLCQIAVHLSYATTAGHTLIDRRLYLPEAWAADDERRDMAGVPDEITFATKPQLAAQMLAAWQARGITDAWVAGDEVYGGRKFRTTLRSLNFRYVLAVKTDHRVTTPAGTSTVADLAHALPTASWQRLRTGTGTKGDRHYDWAAIDIRPDDAPQDRDGHGETGQGASTLLIRRHRYTCELSFYRCWSPSPRLLRELVAVVCRRWKIEEDFQAAKGLTGLDQGQVTTWTSWHRWSLISLLAHMLLAVTVSLDRASTAATAAASIGLVPLSCRELTRLLRRFHARAHDIVHALRWSLWRRRHQHRAARCHRRWNEVTAASIT
ncbi:IS701 family transposase [Microtetraspora sp. NBRC 16547]|uniref:IS701 family transposase n=1 Tax=Microtetraspora sp. NBRC 16547 TaxID=3030993 RepID=UPI0025536FDE|nr:IS701 family transposase [Microtetraspora sp. NBRC 16547]